jgi:succinate dehydrogenase / fumarate reductase cytochrome b subunit
MSNILSKEFLLRRIHSLAGLFFLLFLCEHLWTNAQAVLPFGKKGAWFIESVNFIYSLPYLHALEIFFIALPAGIHAYFGILRILTSECNSFSSDGHTSFFFYSKNRCFTFMRITSWLLLAAICLHVAYMKYLHAPQKEIDNKYTVLMAHENTIVETKDIGSAYLLVLQDTYSSMLFKLLYSLFVVIAAFHSCNGLWTFCLSWGITVTEKAQFVMRCISTAAMLILMVFGMACIWGVNG